MNTLDLDTPLIDFIDKEGASSWTVRDAFEGVQIFGGIGSGKTSGSGRMLALKYLANGFGGLVLTAKPDEKAMWQQYCEQANRSSDLIVLEPGSKERFNFLEYESLHSGLEQSLTENLVQVLKTVIQAGEEKNSGKSDDAFWDTALDMLMFNVIDLCQLAYGKVSVQDMYDIVATAPKKPENATEANLSEKEKMTAFKKAYRAAQDKIAPLYDAWEAKYTTEQLIAMDKEGTFNPSLFEAVPSARLMSFIDQFFVETYRNLSEKTRSIIEFSFSGFLFRLLKDPVFSLFCNQSSTVKPDDCLSGKIILLNLPVKLYGKVGRDCQIMFKYIWQRTMEKRNVGQNGRPVFLWADEAQNFLHEHDADYQATARSSRIATVYISQNLPNYHANMGGGKSEYKVKSFLGTLATKFFHANADIETNKYSSELIGEAYEEDMTNTSTVAGNFSSSKSRSFKLVRMVRPEEFVSLRTGGPKNKFRVEAYIHRQGNQFHNEHNYRLVKFNQDYHLYNTSYEKKPVLPHRVPARK